VTAVAQRPIPIVAPAPPAARPGRRLGALDAFRGLTMMTMILVNNQGSGAHAFWGLAHAQWNGWSGADPVFPAFLFIVGASMALAFSRPTPPSLARGRADRRARGPSGPAAKPPRAGDTAAAAPANAACSAGGRTPEGGYDVAYAPSLAKILRRSFLLVLIGVVLNGFPYGDLGELRYMGVLQRIGLCYLLAALLVRWVPIHKQVAVAAVALVGYWLVVLLPVPGHAAFTMTPAVSVPGHFDQVVMGVRHVYFNRGYDPEGLLSTIPAVVSVLAGFWAATWLRRQPVSGETSKRLALVGAATVVGGMEWGAVFPINKRLWTSSFVVITAGFALLLLAACFELVEVRGRERAARPFVVFGKNALIVFILSEEAGFFVERFGWRPWLYDHVFVRASFSLGSLLYGLAFVAVWWWVTWALDRRRVYIRV